MVEFSFSQINLHADHIKAVNAICPELDAVGAGTHICSNGFVLPEADVGHVWHIPISWLGDSYDSYRQVNMQRRFGWKKLPYLFVLPYPSFIDIDRQIALCPESRAGSFMRRELNLVGIDLSNILVTYACRFALPEGKTSYSQRHKACNFPYVLLDIAATLPSVIVLFGAMAVNSVFGNKVKFGTYHGSVVNCKFGDTSIPVITTGSPLAFVSGYSNLSVFRSELKSAKAIVEKSVVQVVKPEPDYKLLQSVSEIVEFCKWLKAQKPRHIAFDTEFGSDVAREEFSKTITLQLAWAADKARLILFRKYIPPQTYWIVSPTGKERSDDKPRPVKCRKLKTEAKRKDIYTEEELKLIWAALADLFSDKDIRLDGHHLRVDIDRFHKAGFPIDARVKDGFDTMLVHHVLYSDEEQGLDHLVRKYAPEFGAYWHELENWLTCNGYAAQIVYGYNNIPDDILIPYAYADAAATWVVAEQLEKALSDFMTLKALYWDHVAKTSYSLLRIERNGLLVDEDRRMSLLPIYQTVYDAILNKLRESLCWPDFNIRSRVHIQSVLFDKAEYKGKSPTPPGVKAFGLTPLYNTDKRPKEWNEIVLMGDELKHSPGVKATVLQVLFSNNPEIVELKWMYQLSVLGKFLSSYLKPVSLNKYGVVTDGKGFHNNICADGRVRTHFSQLTESGRNSSRKPNLHTSPKRQEEAAQDIFIDHYLGLSREEYKFRCNAKKCPPDQLIPADKRVKIPKWKSCIIPAPGWVLVEVDDKSAELYMLAYLSNDTDMIKLLTSGRDMHAETAVKSFNLLPNAAMADAIIALESGQKSVYLAWLDEVKHGYSDYRVAAKSVRFGVLYGRQSRALALEVKRVSGLDIGKEGAQAIIDHIAQANPVAWKWLQAQGRHALEYGWIDNAYDRRRWFHGVEHMSKAEQSAVTREAKNHPLQGTVAEVNARAGQLFDEFIDHKIDPELDFKVLLPIHDAYLFEVKEEHVLKFKVVVELCMSTLNIIPGTNYHLDVDIDVMSRWGESI